MPQASHDGAEKPRKTGKASQDHSYLGHFGVLS